MFQRLVALALLFCSANAAFAQEQRLLDETTDKWVLTNSPEPGSPEAQLAVATKRLAEEKHDEAIRLASIWIEKHKRHPLLGEAHMIRGDALFAQEEYYESLFDYEFVAEAFYGTSVEIAANQKELAIGTMFAQGLKKKLWGMRISDATDEAAELLMRVQQRLPRSPMAQEACMTLADMYFRKKEMKLANKTYFIFLQNYRKIADPKLIAKAQARLIDTRLATYRGPFYNNSGLLDAKNELNKLQLTNPRLSETINSTSLITRINESFGQKLLATAKWYLETNKPVSAEYTIRRLIKEYPNTSATIEALEDIIPELMKTLPSVLYNEVSSFYAIHQEALLGETTILRTAIEDLE